MVSVPAVCDTCGTIWDPHVIEIEDSTNIGIFGAKVQPCPVCQGVGSLVSGVYTAVGDTLSIVAAANYPPETLALISEVITRGVEARRSLDEIADELQPDAPEVAEAVRKLLVPQTAGELYALLGLIVASIALLLRTPGSVTPAQVNQIVERAVAHAVQEAEQHSTPPGTRVPSLKKKEGFLAPRPGHAGRKPKKPKRRGRRHR